MKTKSVYALMTAIVATFMFVNCSGGGTSRLAGEQCSQQQDLVPTLKEGQEKLSLKAEDGELPPAEYIYKGADLYYVSNTGFQVHIQHKLENGTFGAYTACVRNAATGTPKESFMVESVQSLSVKETGEVSATLVEFGFRVDANGALIPYALNSDVTVTDLEKPFLTDPGKPLVNDKYMVKVNDSTYQIRVEGEVEAQGKYFLSMSFNKPAVKP